MHVGGIRQENVPLFYFVGLTRESKANQEIVKSPFENQTRRFYLKWRCWENTPF